MQAISMIDMEREGLIKNYKSPLSIGGQQLLSAVFSLSISPVPLCLCLCDELARWRRQLVITD